MSQLNRLSKEKSPYLKQHANNPVDWFPWGEEAFAKARAENKPIFLSIGYSTCYWCHVMEKECFEISEVGEALSRDFVSVKVDREEHPEVDEIYMDAVIAMTGQGGWPMSVFLTPDLKPFWGGTYVPREHFLQLVSQVAKVWKETPEQITTSGARLMEALKEEKAEPSSENLAQLQLLERFAGQAHSRFDKVNGGFGPAPKFPSSQVIRVLLRLFNEHQQPILLEMAEKSLERMSTGGIYDQLGGGFHRYSTDDKWLVPHFEKMLYDNALLVPAYLEAWQLTKKEMYADVARETLDYLLRDMKAPGGAFFSAEDAGNVGKEGEFYVWTLAELQGALGKELSSFSAVYPVTKAGNFEHGTNVLHLEEPSSWKASRELREAREILLSQRDQRRRPHRDEKILTSWNGLALYAFASGYRALGDERFLSAAVTCATWLKANLWNGKTLLRRHCDGESKYNGNAADYAFLIQGLIALYEATFTPEWLLWARELQAELDRSFWSEEIGAYHSAAASEANLITRKIDRNDGALPSPNSVSYGNLIRLSQYFVEPDLDDRAARIFEAHGNFPERVPMGVPALLLGMQLRSGNGPRLLVMAGVSEAESKKALELLRGKFQPDLLLSAGVGIPVLDGKTASTPTAFLCEDGVCKAPAPLFDTIGSL